MLLNGSFLFFNIVALNWLRTWANINTGSRLTYAGSQRGLALLVPRGAAVTPEAGHPFSTQALTRCLIAPAAHRSQRMALTCLKREEKDIKITTCEGCYSWGRTRGFSQTISHLRKQVGVFCTRWVADIFSKNFISKSGLKSTIHQWWDPDVVLFDSLRPTGMSFEKRPL